MTPLITRKLPKFRATSSKAINKSKLALALIVSMGVWSQCTSASTIIYDTFTAPDLTLPTSPSHNPNINTTGNGGYVVAPTGTPPSGGNYTGNINGIIRDFSSGGSGGILPNGTYAQFGGRSAIAISLAGSTATSFTLSADLSPANSSNGTVGLGFFSSAPDTSGTGSFPGLGNFSGLALSNHFGLVLVVDGAYVEFKSTSRPANDYTQLSHLSFTINTTTGLITSASMTTGSTTDTFTFNSTDYPLVFTLANLNYVGLGSTSPGSGDTSVGSGDYYANSLFATNFTVAAVPEPSTLAMLGLGLAGSVVLRKVGRG